MFIEDNNLFDDNDFKNMNLKKGILKGIQQISEEQFYKIYKTVQKIEDIENEFKEEIEEHEDRIDCTNIQTWREGLVCSLDGMSNIWIVNIDDKSYIAYEDPDDGYRSYGEVIELPIIECYNNFPVQVEVEYTSDRYVLNKSYEEKGIKTVFDTRYNLMIFKDKKEVFSVYTDYTEDSYYPSGNTCYTPENLGKINY